MIARATVFLAFIAGLAFLAWVRARWPYDQNAQLYAVLGVPLGLIILTALVAAAWWR